MPSTLTTRAGDVNRRPSSAKRSPKKRPSASFPPTPRLHCDLTGVARGLFGQLGPRLIGQLVFFPSAAGRQFLSIDSCRPTCLHVAELNRELSSHRFRSEATRSKKQPLSQSGAANADEGGLLTIPIRLTTHATSSRARHLPPSTHTRYDPKRVRHALRAPRIPPERVRPVRVAREPSFYEETRRLGMKTPGSCRFFPNQRDRTRS